MTISATTQGIKPGVCLSTNRPVNPFDGQVIYMTDVDQTAVWDGSQWTVLAPIAGGRNRIINGDFRINQRGFSSTTTSSTYGFDRWFIGFSGGTVTYSAQTFTAGAAPYAGYEGINFARVVTASQSAAGDFAYLQQRIEDVRTFANQTITVSFFAKASTGTPTVGVVAEQQFGTGGSSSVVTSGGTTAITTSWARYSKTISIPSIAGKTIGTGSVALNIGLMTSVGTTISGSGYPAVGVQNATIDFWGVQVEAGAVATPFEFEDYGTTLEKCQRYYFRLVNGATQNIGSCYYYANTYARAIVHFPTSMRTAPTLVSSTGTDYYGFLRNGGIDTFNSWTMGGAPSVTTTTIYNETEASGTAGQAGEAYSNNGAASVAFSSEL
jgi:hypothetical protein